jgi:hypothetical protein
MTCPVMQLACAEAIKATSSAIYYVLPQRPSGISASNCLSPLPMYLADMGPATARIVFAAY